jgi:hypothetical protein
MKISLLHACRINGQTVRHRAPLDWTEVKLNSGHLRLGATRCDGTSIEAYGNRLANGDLVAYNENADTHDPDRHERTMYEFSTGREWISKHYGPWELLLDEFPGQPTTEPEQPSLLDVLAELSPSTSSKDA